MNDLGRRNFLNLIGSGALAAAVETTIGRALAIPANDRTRSIEDIEHIVILTQENRSFDHYFGTMRGVRGYSDPRAVTLPSGKNVFHQPAGAGEVLPFRPPVESFGNTFVSDPPHGWNDTHAAWNQGAHDNWVAPKGIVSMTHHNRRDIPFHFALADAFTICDAYHCSVMGPTDPNRYHLWTGWVGNDGAGGGPVITNAEAGYDWTSFPERLNAAGISWKVYQDIGLGLTAAGFWGWTGAFPYMGNYGDNALLYLHQYQNAQPGNALADRAKVGTNIGAKGQNPDLLVQMFRSDVQSGKLPKISWIVAPEAYTEHPNWGPNFGAWYISQFLDALISNPDVFSKTALFINYDEEGGFFDHMVPPTPPATGAQGLSTVPTTHEIYTSGGGHPDGPYGLGMRVPMIVVSPWTKGGWVNSEVFDHTSLIRFVETRFARETGGLLREHNITPWRRAVAGDLTSAFDFSAPNTPQHFRLPDTSAYKPKNFNFYPDFPVAVPAVQSVPTQEPGIRPSRALPYTLHAHGVLHIANNSFQIDFGNKGTATAVFHVRSGGGAHAPRTYTVEPGKSLTDNWLFGSMGLGNVDLSVHGPNGFFRSFKGSVAGLHGKQLDVVASYDTKKPVVTLTISNTSSQPAKVSVLDKYSGDITDLPIKAGAAAGASWNLKKLSGWYDLVVTLAGDSSIEYHLAGRAETGSDSISDPWLGGYVSSKDGEDEKPNSDRD